MAYVVRRANGSWELRESRSTDAGPRSRTLTTFRTLTPDAIAHARERAGAPLDPATVRRLAHRAGAPVAPNAADQASAALLTELAAGRAPRRALRQLLVDALGAREPERTPSDSARAASAWVAATPAQRGEALRDLLLLADRIPASPRRTSSAAERFPRLQSTTA